MKILHVLDHSVPLFSGYSFRSRNIVQGQRALGLEPVVLTSPKHGSRKDDIEELEGILHYRTGSLASDIAHGIPVAKEIELMAHLARRIEQVARKEKVHLVHSHSPLLNGLPALWIARRLGIPVVYEARAFWEDAAVDHGSFKEGSLRYRLSRSLETILFRSVDRVVTICEGMRRELTTRGIKLERVQVVPNGVDLARFQPQTFPSSLAKRLGVEGKPRFGFIGSFYHYEGLRFLIESFSEISRQVRGARLILVGGGKEESLLKELASHLNGSVIFTGQVPHEQVQEYYSLIDILVFPRRRMRLTELVTPLKPLEAMAMAKPVLASDVGGHKELIEHGKTGLLFAADSKHDLVAGAVRMATDPGLRRALSESARRYVTKTREWRVLVQRYLTLYEELLRQRANGKALGIGSKG